MFKRIAALVTLGLTLVGGYLFYYKVDTHTYVADEEGFNNALMGYAPGITSGNSAESDAQLRHLYLSWRELEPEEGVYDWEGIDKKYGLSELREQGIHLVFRFYCDYPRSEQHLDIPDWLYEKTGDGSWYTTSYGSGYSPDYSNEVFRAAHAKVMAEIGRHFGEDTFVSYVELGSLGHWGEWHIKSEDGLVPMPGEEIRDEYVLSYIDAFPNAKLLMRRPFNIAAEKGLGVYNDMTGDPVDTQNWFSWLANGGSFYGEQDAMTAISNFWLIAPVGGELTSAVSREEMLDTKLSRTLDLLDESHMTFLGPNSPDYSYANGYYAILRHMGYRLRVKGAMLKRSTSKATLTLTWTNDGVAPFYWDWDVNIYIEDAEGNTLHTQTLPLKLTELTPGASRTVSVELADAQLKLLESGESAERRITVGIVDPMTGKDAVRLAMQASRTENGRTVLFSEIK